MSKVFSFAFQIYHAFQIPSIEGRRIELQIVWKITVRGLQFYDTSSNLLSSFAILRHAGQHRETRLIIDR